MSALWQCDVCGSTILTYEGVSDATQAVRAYLGRQITAHAMADVCDPCAKSFAHMARIWLGERQELALHENRIHA